MIMPWPLYVFCRKQKCYAFKVRVRKRRILQNVTVENDLTLGGYENWTDFKSKMDAAGYTTAAEYKSALDAAIAENQKSNESGTVAPTESTPSDDDTDKKFSHLYWIIPLAIIMLAAAVILPATLRKRKGN